MSLVISIFVITVDKAICDLQNILQEVLMEKQDFNRRFLFPVIIVFIVMTISFLVYYGSRLIENQNVFMILARISGTTYFLSVAFGTIFVYSVSYIRGASLGERILASVINPFIWATKECIKQLEVYSVAESLYYYLNPLNFWLICLMVLEMGIATLIARWILKRRREGIRIATAAPLLVIAVSLFVFIFMYAWGKGENVYVIFLKGYRLFFGTGV
jgi:hypothetical protein